MIGSTLTKVKAGDPLRIRADTFNSFIDAAQAHRAGQLKGSGDPPKPRVPVEILVKITDRHLLVGEEPYEQQWLYQVEAVVRDERAAETTAPSYSTDPRGFASDAEEMRTWMINVFELTDPVNFENVSGDGAVEIDEVTFTRAVGFVRRMPLPIGSIVPAVLRTVGEFTCPECREVNPTIPYCPPKDEEE